MRDYLTVWKEWALEHKEALIIFPIGFLLGLSMFFIKPYPTPLQNLELGVAIWGVTPFIWLLVLLFLDKIRIL